MEKLSRKDQARLLMKSEAQVNAVILALIYCGFVYLVDIGLPVDAFSLSGLFIVSWAFIMPIVWRWLEYKMACMEEANGTQDESEDSDGWAEAEKWRAIAGYYWMNRRR
ncbi:hypothetical protein BAE30_06065 [Acidithiobacillus caldus]|uniref:Uncharacterized protein n=1 Tax=Acidithiobacillus caldus TaxID=33059 RepID=A0A1E7YX54_9PROT|nr:hypothetical protein BAE30_06065 [Acidithiobacillus caldus]